MNTRSNKRVFEIFRAGTHTAMSGETIKFSVHDVAAMVAIHSAQKRLVPLCPGHPENDRPVLGLVEALHSSHGDTRLFARAEVSPRLLDMVRSGEVTGISCAFMKPQTPGNNTVAYMLKHVGFLPPTSPTGVRDLPTPSFSAPAVASFAEWSAAAAASATRRVAANPGLSYSEAVQQFEDEIWRSHTHFAAPRGFSVSPDSLAINELAREYLRACPELSYIEAVRLAERHSKMH